MAWRSTPTGRSRRSTARGRGSSTRRSRSAPRRRAASGPRCSCQTRSTRSTPPARSRSGPSRSTFRRRRRPATSRIMPLCRPRCSSRRRWFSPARLPIRRAPWRIGAGGRDCWRLPSGTTSASSPTSATRRSGGWRRRRGRWKRLMPPAPIRNAWWRSTRFPSGRTCRVSDPASPRAGRGRSAR